MRVAVDRRLLRGFLQRAKKALPAEYMESLWGRVGKRKITILALGPVTQEASRSEVNYEEDDLEDKPIPGLQYLGTLHTHIGQDATAAPSEEDWCSSDSDSDLLVGICHINQNARPGARIRFWPSVKPYEVLLA